MKNIKSHSKAIHPQYTAMNFQPIASRAMGLTLLEKKSPTFPKYLLYANTASSHVIWEELDEECCYVSSWKLKQG